MVPWFYSPTFYIISIFYTVVCFDLTRTISHGRVLLKVFNWGFTILLFSISLFPALCSIHGLLHYFNPLLHLQYASTVPPNLFHFHAPFCSYFPHITSVYLTFIICFATSFFQYTKCFKNHEPLLVSFPLTICVYCNPTPNLPISLWVQVDQ